MYISASSYFMYLVYLIWLSAAFTNRKVWVGSDNQAHDAPTHIFMCDSMITLKLGIFEI